ncbi:MAG: trimeric intracellular cation channel family protein [Bacteroidota bacterium]
MTINFLQVIDILGTAAFAVSGARSAMQKRLDVFGVVAISFATAIGGGTLRDILIGSTPVAWLRNETTVLVILISVIATLFFDSSSRYPKTLFLFDSLGLGLFTLVGIEKGIAAEFSPGICLALGTITACFGGVIRDVLLNNVPVIFRKEIYASACFTGGLLYYFLHYFSVYETLAQIVCIASIVCIRVFAVRYHLSLPSFYKQEK